MSIHPKIETEIEETITLLEKCLGPVLDRTNISHMRTVMTYLYIKGRIEGYERCQQATKTTESLTGS